MDDELSESESTKVPKQKRQRKIKYGGLDDLNVEELPSRRTRGRQINYQENIGTDSEEEFKGTKNTKKAIIKDDEEEFVAEKEDEKDESDASSDGDEEDFEEEEKSSSEDEETKTVEDKGKSKEQKSKSEITPAKILSTNASPPIKVSPPKTVDKEKSSKRRGRPPKAMIAPPPERLISEDEQYKAVVSKVSTMGHTDHNIDIKNEVNPAQPDGITEQNRISAEDNSFLHQVTPVKVANSAFEPKLALRNPPLKIRSGVAVNAGGRRSPALVSPTNENQFFSKSPNSGMVHSPPDRSQFSPQLQRSLMPGKQSRLEQGRRPHVNHQSTNVKTEIVDDDLEDDDIVDDIEEEEDDEDDSDDDVLEEGEIPKKVARRMAREEERLQRIEERKLAQQLKQGKSTGLNVHSSSPGSAQPLANSQAQPTPTTQPSQPMLRLVSPLKLMANPPGPLQSTFLHGGMNPRMPMPTPPPARMGMPIRPPQPMSLMPGMDDSSPTKRRGRGRGKKQAGPEKPEQELSGGGSVIRGMLQQPQSYPPTHYPQQYPSHPRLPFSPQRMPRPPFHPGQHHPLDPSPSGGGPINTKQEPGVHPASNPVNIPNKPPPHPSAPPYHPPPHRFELRPPNYPPQVTPPAKPQYGSYPPPPAPSGNYHFGSYPPPMTQREDPQVFPVQQQFSEQYQEQQQQPPPPPLPAQPPTAPVASAAEDTGEFGGLVSYFSSQREDNIDT